MAAPVAPDPAIDEPSVYVRGMERLVDAVRDLACARSLSDVIDIVRHVARELTGADGATFVLRDEDRCFYVEENAIAPLWRGLKFPMETCISGWAMLNRQTAVITDIYADDRIPHDAYRPTFVKSLVMVPIRTVEPVGAIGNYWATPHEATPTEVRLLQALADSTAVAMESVRLLDELERRVEDRTAQLAAANADLQQFSAIAAHDLRGPLATLGGYVQLLDAQLGQPGGPVGVALGAIDRMTARLLGLVDDLLALARAGSSDLTRAPVDLDALVTEVLATLQHAVDERAADIRRGPLGSVDADATLLGQAVQNLVGNALAYVAEGVRPVVRIDAGPVSAGWELRVADNGPGVPAEERARIVEPFMRGGAGAGRPGSGLGLAICRRVAERHGGRLEIRDAPEGGAEFAVVLPLLPAG